MDEPKVDASHEQEESAEAAPAAADHDPAPAPADAVEGTNGVAADDEPVVDEVSRLIGVDLLWQGRPRRRVYLRGRRQYIE